jgi:hypothetical protein
VQDEIATCAAEEMLSGSGETRKESQCKTKNAYLWIGTISSGVIRCPLSAGRDGPAEITRQKNVSSTQYKEDAKSTICDIDSESLPTRHILHSEPKLKADTSWREKIIKYYFKVSEYPSAMMTTI